jgi:hypothetical protein
MSRKGETAAGPSRLCAPIGYERPQVEWVLTSEELEREILYAGVDALPASDSG